MEKSRPVIKMQPAVKEGADHSGPDISETSALALNTTSAASPSLVSPQERTRYSIKSQYVGAQSHTQAIGLGDAVRVEGDQSDVKRVEGHMEGYQEQIASGKTTPGKLIQELMTTGRIEAPDYGLGFAALLKAGIRPQFHTEPLKPEALKERAGLADIHHVYGSGDDILAVVDQGGNAAVQVMTPHGAVVVNDYFFYPGAFRHNEKGLGEENVFIATTSQDPEEKGANPLGNLHFNMRILAEGITSSAGRVAIGHELGHLLALNRGAEYVFRQVDGRVPNGYGRAEVGQFLTDQTSVLMARAVPERMANEYAEPVMEVLGFSGEDTGDLQRRAYETYDMCLLSDIGAVGAAMVRDYDKRPVSPEAKQAFKDRVLNTTVRPRLLAHGHREFPLRMNTVIERMRAYTQSDNLLRKMKSVFPLRDGVSIDDVWTGKGNDQADQSVSPSLRPELGVPVNVYGEGNVRLDEAVARRRKAWEQNPADPDTAVAYALTLNDQIRITRDNDQVQVQYERIGSILDSIPLERQMETVFVRNYTGTWSVNDTLLDLARASFNGGIVSTQPEVFRSRMDRSIQLLEAYMTAANFSSDIALAENQFQKGFSTIYTLFPDVGQFMVEKLTGSYARAAASLSARNAGPVAARVQGLLAKHCMSFIPAEKDENRQEMLLTTARYAAEAAVRINSNDQEAHETLLGATAGYGNTDSIRDNVRELSRFYRELEANQPDNACVRYHAACVGRIGGNIENDAQMLRDAYDAMHSLAEKGYRKGEMVINMAGTLREVNAAEYAQGRETLESVQNNFEAALGHLDSIPFNDRVMEEQARVCVDYAHALHRLGNAADNDALRKKSAVVAQEAVGWLEKLQKTPGTVSIPEGAISTLIEEMNTIHISGGYAEQKR